MADRPDQTTSELDATQRVRIGCAALPPGLSRERYFTTLGYLESEDSFFWTQQLMEQCGIFAGISSGAAIACSRKMAEKIGDGTIEIPGRGPGEANIVALLPDGGWKYMSTELWTKSYKEIVSEVEGKIWW